MPEHRAERSRSDGGKLMATLKTRSSLIVTITIIVLALTASTLRAEISPRDMQALAKTGLIYVATVRKDGNQSRSAPVWFTISADGNAVLIQTKRDTWKAKRIRRGSPVLVWIGASDGPAFLGDAEITEESAVREKILADFKKKYWENRVMGVGPSRARFESGERIAIKITPVRDLPNGFRSAPGTPPPRRRTIAPQPVASR
jgi:general stress protein 26